MAGQKKVTTAEPGMPGAVTAVTRTTRMTRMTQTPLRRGRIESRGAAHKSLQPSAELKADASAG